MQVLGNCPSRCGHRDADDALGWQLWRLLLVLICVFLITKLSYHSSFSRQPQSLAGVLLAEAGKAVCEVAVVGRCHWGLLCSLGPLGEVLSEHKRVILGFCGVLAGFVSVSEPRWHQRLQGPLQGQRVWQLHSCARTTLFGTCQVPGAHPSPGNHGDRAAQLLELSWGPSPLFLVPSGPCKRSGMGRSCIGGSPHASPASSSPSPSIGPSGLQDPLLFFKDVKPLDAPKAMANGLHRPERM